MTDDLPRWFVSRLEAEEESTEHVEYGPFASEDEAIARFNEVTRADPEHRYLIVQAEVGARSLPHPRKD